MMKRVLTIVFAWLLLGSGWALAQDQPVPPERYTVDERGVDLVRGTASYLAEEVVIGPRDQGGIVYGRAWVGDGWRDLLSGSIAISGSTYTVSVGAESEVFILSGGIFTPVSNNGSTLTQSGATWTYRGSTGLEAYFVSYPPGVQNPWLLSQGRLVSWIRQPNGEILNFNYQSVPYCRDRPPIEPPPPPCTLWGEVLRLQSVSNNRGYMVHFTYAVDAPTGTDFREFFLRTSATGINLAIDYCSPVGNSCTGLTQTWPSVTYANILGGHTVTDQSGRTTTYKMSASRLTSVRYPGSASDDITITNTSGRVTSYAVAGSTWTYAYTDVGTTRTTTITNPGSSTVSAVSDQSIARLTSYTNELSQTTSYLYDGQRRLERATHPEGNYTQYSYDGRGNITTTTHVAKPGSGLSNIVTSAAYPASCINPVTCNRPTSVTDPRGGVTDFTWDSTHGGILTVTEPAPTGGAARPQTRFTYETHYAWYKNALGTQVQAPTAITQVNAISACVTGTSCTDAANETRTTIAYGSAGVANNRLATATTNRNGTGTLTATTAFTWTAMGDLATQDGPLSGTTDTTYFRYDAARQLVGVIGPDPDGAGALLRRAERNTYNPRGQITLTEQGTVTGTDNSAWAAFATLQQVANQYDAYGRPTHTRVQASSTTYSLTQASYDNRSRVECVTTRMNAATFASPPSSACTLATAGSFGPDRAVRYLYDAASQLTSVTSGYASGSPITQSYTYTNNGQLASAQDGAGNVSVWVYDGFDRLYRLRFPNATGGGTSTTDYLQYGYDAASNVTSFRTRAGDTFTTTYDALNRRTFLDAPGAMADTTYTYDNLGRPTGASQTGHAQTFAWDALSRLISQTGPLGTFSFQYDAVSRRTRITWPDTYYAQYDWSLYDEVTAVRENGASSGIGVLATYAYDNLGRRSTVTRGNGAGTTYGYDPVSRLTSIAHNLTGTSDDVTFTLTYNPASQIVSRVISNNAYIFGQANQNTSYSNNGRNELTAAGASSFTYDNNRNVTNDGTRAYTYDEANRMLSAGAAGFSYDATGALYDIGAHRLASVGGERLALYTTSGGALHRRIVPGASPDEAAAYYHGSGTTTRQWPLVDQLGSVIAYSNASGAAANINTYDEYGRPGSSNAEFIQYTGQLAINSEPGVYNYRTRFYQSHFGRFLQTDSILYGAGLNLYAYVGNDPINWRDFWGMERCDPETEICVPGFQCPQGATCITDQNEIEEILRRNIVDDIVVTGARRRSLGGVRINQNLRFPREQVWIITRDFSVIPVETVVEETTDRCGRRVGRNRVADPSSLPPASEIIAVVHTHPREWADARPGPEDYAAASSRDLYGIPSGGVWVLRRGAEPGSAPETLSGRPVGAPGTPSSGDC